MALSATQLDLLKTASNFIHTQNATAQTLGVTLTMVYMVFPPVEDPALVKFIWNGVDGYNIQIQN